MKEESPILTVKGVFAVVTAFLILAGGITLFDYLDQDQSGPKMLETDLSQSEVSCKKSDFSMVFVLLIEDQSQATQERIDFLNQTKSDFENSFARATENLASMDTSSDVLVLNIGEVEDAIQNGNLNLVAILNEFYENYEEEHDFLSFYTAFDPSGLVALSTQFHVSTKNDVEGIGKNIYNISDTYGAKNGTLRGFNFLGYVDKYQNTYAQEITRNTIQNALLHETGHSWCCYAGDNFGEGDSLEIKQQGIHYYIGLQSGDSVRNSMNAHAWEPNGDGTFKDVGHLNEEGNIGLFKYHPFTLYFMGVLPENRYDEEYAIYDAGDWKDYQNFNQENAPLYKKVSVMDIIEEEGEIKCASPVSPRSGQDSCTGSISGAVWHDEDQDGTRDSNEQGLDNIAVSINGEISDQVLTDETGQYLFEDLCPSNYPYEISVNLSLNSAALEESLGDTSELNSKRGLTELVILPTEESKEGPDFGFYTEGQSACTGSISGAVWHDEDQDGTRDSNEQELDSIKVLLSGADSQEITSDAFGNFTFSSLCPGDYHITLKDSPVNDGIIGAELGRSDFLSSTESEYSLEVGEDQDKSVQGFGFYLEEEIACDSTVSGYVWHDEDEDGNKDSDEEVIPGARVNLDGIISQEVLTDSSGRYIFEDLCSGPYEVSINLSLNRSVLEDYLGSDSDLHYGDLSQSFSLGDPENKGNVNFGFWIPSSEVPASISGHVFFDENENGQMDTGEEDVEGIWVNLVDENNNMTFAYTEASSGYQFSDVAAGDYTLTVSQLVLQQVGYSEGIVSPEEVTLNIDWGDNLDSQNFAVIVGEDDDQDDNDDSDDQDDDIDDQDDDDNDGSGDDNDNTDGGDEDEEECAGSISGYVWEDEDEDGDRDSDEDGLEDVKVSLSGDESEETKTNSRGKYKFSNLCAGDYEVEVDEDDAEDELGTDHTKRTTTDDYEVDLEDDNDDEDDYDFGFLGWDTPDTGISAGGLVLIFALSLVLTLGVLIGIQKYQVSKAKK